MNERIPFEEMNDFISNEIEPLKLGFINYVGEDENGKQVYEFVFTDNIDEFWGENFEYSPCCLVNNLHPYEQYITEKKTVRSPYKLSLIQDSCCFGFQDCADGICSIGYAYDDEDEIFLNFNFGEKINEVELQLAHKSIIFE